MSYILDALKKSDQERSRGSAPTLLTAQTPATEARAATSTWAYAMLVLALAAAGVAVGWMRPWHAEQPARTPLDAPAAAQRPVSENETKSARAEPLPKPDEPAKSPEPSVLKTATASPAPKPPPARPAKETKAPPKDMKREPAPAARVEAVTGKQPAADAKVLSLADLPPALQRDVPGMTIAVHAYSHKSEERLVSINDRVLREGEELSAGLKLEQITPDGMVFSYKGYRFRRGVL